MGATPSSEKPREPRDSTSQNPPSPRRSKEGYEDVATASGRTVLALKELQETLHRLTPAEQWEVKKALPFATSEWQEGLALSLKPPQIQFGESVHGKMDFQNKMREIETAHKKRERLTSDVEKLVLVLVGLPARGKSMYGHKLSQFLSWRGYKVKNFGVGAWRRGDRNPGKAKLDFGDASPTTKRRGLKGLASFAEDAPAPEDPKKEEQRGQFSSASFFDSSKSFAAATREQVRICMHCLHAFSSLFLAHPT